MILIALVPDAHGISPGITREIDEMLDGNYTMDQIEEKLMAIFHDRANRHKANYDQLALRRKDITNGPQARKGNKTHTEKLEDALDGLLSDTTPFIGSSTATSTPTINSNTFSTTPLVDIVS